MRSKSNLTLIMASLGILVLTAITACTKDRPERFADGNGTPDLLKIESYDNKYYNIQTLEPLAKSEQTSGMSRAEVENVDTGKVFNNLPLVKYKTKAPLFKDVPFRAVPNSNKYKLLFKVEQHNLMVFKVAHQKYIPYQERTYARDLGNNILAVPMLGYPISGFFNVDHIKNNDNEKTNIKFEKHTLNRKEASFFKANFSSRRLMQPKVKLDVLPVEYFKGDWFYNATLIEKNSKIGGLVGMDFSSDFKFGDAARIAFRASDQELRAINLNVDPDLVQGSSGKPGSKDIQFDTVLRIPAEKVDYRIKPNGAGDSLLEEELNDNHPDSRLHTQRKYIKLHLGRTTSAIFKHEHWLDKAIVQDISISDSYLGYTVYYRNQGVTIRFSLMRAWPALKGRTAWWDDIRRKYGFFQSQKDFLYGYKIHRDRELEKNTLIKRFYPGHYSKKWTKSKNSIDFHFSTTTPKDPEIRQAARKAVEAWDHAFKKAGTRYSINLKDGPNDRDVNIGDIRYNVINIIDDKDRGRTLGFGPSVADPLSGEIISATTNIYLNPIRSSLVSTLRHYVYYRLGLFGQDSDNLSVPEALKGLIDAAAVDSPLNSTPSVAPKRLTQFIAPERISLKESLNAHDTYLCKISSKEKQKTFFSTSTHREPIGTCKHSKNVKKESAHDFHKEQQLMIKNFLASQNLSALHGDRFSSCAYSLSQGRIIKDVQKLCSDTLLPYIERIKAANQGKTKKEQLTYIEGEEIKVLEACANKMIPEYIFDISLHEIGHNFGLRHNFSASVDKRNFDNPESDFSSSVMDYLSSNAPPQLKVGPYDIAAIRYGYAQQVQLQDAITGKPLNQFLKLDPQYTIEENLRRKSHQLGANTIVRKFKFCSDEERHGVFPTSDPFCNAHDWGANPYELAKNKIIEFNAFIKTYSKRLDRMFNPTGNGNGLGAIAKARFFFPMSKIYSQWRLAVQEFAGDIKHRNLEYYTDSQYKELVDLMKHAPASQKSELLGKSYRDLYKEYYPAAEMIKDFFLKMAFLPGRSCVVTEKKTQQTRLISFVLFIAKLNDNSLKGCSDPKIAKYLGSQYSVHPEGIGHFMADRDFRTRKERSLNENGKGERWDFLGLHSVVSSAIGSLTKGSGHWSRIQTEIGLNPSMAHEPELLSKFTDIFFERITKGIHISDLPGLKTDTFQREYFPIFDSNLGNLWKDLRIAIRSQSSRLDEARAHLVTGWAVTQEDLNIKNPGMWVNMTKLLEDKVLHGRPMLGGQYLFADKTAATSNQLLRSYVELLKLNMIPKKFDERNRPSNTQLKRMLMGSIDQKALKSLNANMTFGDFLSAYKNIYNSLRSFQAGKSAKDLTLDRVAMFQWDNILVDYNTNLNLYKIVVYNETPPSQWNLTNNAVDELKRLGISAELLIRGSESIIDDYMKKMIEFINYRSGYQNRTSVLYDVLILNPL